MDSDFRTSSEKKSRIEGIRSAQDAVKAMRTRSRQMEVVEEADVDESIAYSHNRGMSSSEKPPKTVRFEAHYDQNESTAKKNQEAMAKMSKIAQRSAKEFIESKVKMS